MLFLRVGDAAAAMVMLVGSPRGCTVVSRSYTSNTIRPTRYCRLMLRGGDVPTEGRRPWGWRAPRRSLRAWRGPELLEPGDAFTTMTSVVARLCSYMKSPHEPQHMANNYKFIESYSPNYIL